MPRVEKFQFYPVADVHRPVIRHSNRLAGRHNGVMFGVQRRPVKFFAVFMGLFAQILGVAGLYIGGVHHNKAGDVPACRSRVNIPLITTLYQKRQKPAMVKVTVGQNG